MHAIDDFSYYTVPESAQETQDENSLSSEQYSVWLDDFGWI